MINLKIREWKLELTRTDAQVREEEENETTDGKKIENVTEKIIEDAMKMPKLGKTPIANHSRNHKILGICKSKFYFL